MLRFILADLRRLWLGALVMVLLIAMAVALGLGVTLQERALRLGSARAAEKFDLVIGARGSETQLVLSTVFLQPAALPLVSGQVLADLQRDPRVAWAEPVGFGDFYRGYPLVGTSRRLILETAPQFAMGRMFAAEGEAVVGADVALVPGDDLVPSHGQIAQDGHAHDGVSYRVTGKLRPTGTAWDRAILVPVQAVWHVHGLGEAESGDDHAAEVGGHQGHDEHAGDAHLHDETALFDADAPLTEEWQAAGQGQIPAVPAILVKPRSVADAYRLRQDYRADEATLAVFPAEVLTSLYGLLGNARLVLSAVVVAAQVLVAAALLLVSLIHISQRQRQIAALRALGAARSALFTLVWAELFALILSGVMLGVLAGLSMAGVMAGIIARMQGFDLPIEIRLSDFADLAVLLGAAAVLAALPAILAYRHAPAAGLRS
jgi:putative ABC transport system permease protein